MYGYVIFTDIEKYSTLKDADLKIFFNKIIPIISEELKEYKDAAIIWNTWGDAIFAIYDKAEKAINMALAYREAFSKLDFEKFGIKKLNPRIAGNFGEFELIFDPVSGKQNVHGTLVNITARIEPVTTPGEIFVTKEFRDMSISSYDKVDNVRFEDMGEIKLPKNAGVLNLYRLCKRAETPMRPAGLLHSKIDYQIQAPANFSQKSQKPEKPVVEKTIEERLSAKTNKRTFSEEKLNKIANVLKDDKVLQKKTEKNFFKDLIRDIKGKKNPVDLLAHNPFATAFFVFLAAMCINFIVDIIFIKDLLGLNIPIPPDIMAIISQWIWLLGFLAGSFAIGQVATYLKNKLIEIKNVVITPFLIIFWYVCLYILPNSAAPLSVFFLKNIYICALALWFICFLGFSKGTELANDKIKESKGK